MTKEITGPAMQDLKYRADTTYEAIAATVSARGFGNFFGAVLGGILVDKFGQYCDLMNAGWFALMAVMSFATPFTTSVCIRTNKIFFAQLLRMYIYYKVFEYFNSSIKRRCI